MLLVLALQLSLTVVGQTADATLSVTVRDRTGAPVAGAIVEAAGRTAVTDSLGLASLSLPAGTHPITVASAEYLTYSGRVTVTAAETLHLAVELTPRVVREDTLVVTATRTERRIEDQPVRVEIVDREEIEEKALMTPGSVAMLLAETTGLRVQTTSPALGAANGRIQGLRGRYSQLLSDGLPLYGLQGDSLSLLQVPPLDLGQVEIIKGAASALYGPSALGGVINLVSQRPRARVRELLFNVTSQDAADLTFWMMEPPRGAWAWTVLGGVHGQTRQDLDRDGWADLPGYRRGLLRPRLFWDGGDGRTGFATVGLITEERRGGTLRGRSAPDGRPFAQELDTVRVDSGGLLRLPAGANRLLTLRGSFSHRGERRLFGSSLERGSRSTWLGEAVLMGQAGRHTWLVGGAAQQDSFEARDLPRFDYRFTAPGLLVQDEIDVTDRATLGISARLDHHSRYGTFFSPRLSVLYKPAESWSTRLSAGTGFFGPTPFTEETEETGLARVLFPPHLVAERARGVSADVSWTRGPVELVGTLFGSHVRDPLQRRIDEKAVAVLFNDPRPVRTWGTEILFRYRLENFLVLATHGYTRSTEGDLEAAGGRRDVPLTPRHVASLNAIWEDEAWGRVGLEMYYTGRQPLEENPFRRTGRGYLLVGALVERRWGPIRLFLNLENLGDIRQTRYDSLLRPTRAADGRWTVDAWAPLDGRVINGGVRWAF